MPCKSCGSPLDDEFSRCPKCGASPISVLPDSASEMPAIQSTQSNRRVTVAGVLAVIADLAVLAWTFLLARRQFYMAVHSIGTWVGLVALPFLIAFVGTRAWHIRNWIRFSWSFFGLGVFLPIFSITGMNSRHSEASIAKELFANKPLNRDLNVEEEEIVAALRPTIEQMKMTWRADNDQKSALLPDISRLLSKESFANKDAMQHSFDAVNRMRTLDRGISGAIERWPAEFKARLDQSDFSDSAKQQILNDFTSEVNLSDTLHATKQALSVESSWADETAGLYNFALQHTSEIVVSTSGMGISSPATRQQFNDKLARSKELRNQLIIATKHAEEVRSAFLKEEGLTPADIGLEK